MKLFVEECTYTDQQLGYLPSWCREFCAQRGKITYVGYLYNEEINDCIFLLPKVILNPQKLIFGKYTSSDLLEAKDIEKDQIDFLYNLSLWIYMSIASYNRKKPGSEIVKEGAFANIQVEGKATKGSFVDILLSLVKFNNENQNFILFTLRNIHRGYNKINWNKTIGHNRPILQDDFPIYLNPTNKKKQINYDEELLVIFFSILNYINQTYNFRTPVNLNFNLITGAQFNALLDGMGARKLRQIKYRYFSDKTLLLWELCYDFFVKAQNIRTSGQAHDYLIVSTYQNVFESMIDDLIGDPNVPEEMAKHQGDNHRVDHIYPAESLTSADNVYFIGDSKYYGINEAIDSPSINKQYTYARNVIQYNLDLFYKNLKKDSERWSPSNPSGWMQYRDEETEGYNITPNFFISARLDEKDPKDGHFENPLVHLPDEDQHISHFPNRLFDRDTLWLSRYNVNFLYVIKLYTGKNEYEREHFRDDARQRFRDKILKLINKNYTFYRLIPVNGISINQGIEKHFRKLLGKVFKPFNGEDILILALSKGVALNKVQKVALGVENETLKIDISDCFKPIEYKLGEDIVFDFPIQPIISEEISLNKIETESIENEIVVENSEDVSISQRYQTHLPLWTVHAACGHFGEDDESEEEGWIDVSSYGIRLNRNMFIVHAKGKSMEPKINDGDLCIFELYHGGSREGDIVLTQCLDKDLDYRCTWTIKKYHSEKRVTEDGSWIHASIILQSLNPEYENIEIAPEDASDLRTIGVLVKVL